MVSRLDLGSIRALKLVRKEIAELRAYERSIVRPLMPAGVSIEQAYSIYQAVMTERGGAVDALESRKNFIFIAIWLYAPAVLAGDRMPRGLRNSLVSLFGVQAPTIISNNFAQVKFYYYNHRRKRAELTAIANEILHRAQTE